MQRTSSVFHFPDGQDEIAATDQAHDAAPAELGPVLARRGRRLWASGRFAEAGTVLARAIELCTASNDWMNAASAHTAACWLEAWRGAGAKSARHGRHALGLLARAGTPAPTAMTETGLLLCAVFRDRLDDARDHGRRALAASTALDDAGMVATSAMFTAWCEAECGQLQQALGTAALAVDKAPTASSRRWAQVFDYAVRSRGPDGATVLPAFIETVDALERSGHVAGHALAALLLVEALHAHDHRETLDRAVALHDIAVVLPCPFVIAGVRMVQAERAWLNGSASAAHRLFLQAEVIYRETGAAQRARTARAAAAYAENLAG